jgi:hypothetical protein
VKDPDDLAGGPVVSRKSGDLSIGRHLAARDRLDRFLSSGLELHLYLIDIIVFIRNHFMGYIFMDKFGLLISPRHQVGAERRGL